MRGQVSDFGNLRRCANSSPGNKEHGESGEGRPPKKTAIERKQHGDRYDRQIYLYVLHIHILARCFRERDCELEQDF